MSTCVACGRHFADGLECPEVDEPTCSTCCEHADDDGYMDAAIDHHQTVKETTT